MKVDKRKNCYNYEKFGHLVRYCRNQEIVRENRRIEIISSNKILKEKKI